MTEQITSQVNELINNGPSEVEIQEVTSLLSNFNVQKRNKHKTESFTEKIMKRRNEKIKPFVNFLESQGLNGLIYAPTQVGKSAATCVFIETCFRYNTPVIVSTDNKTDQQEQLYCRIKRDLALSGCDAVMLKVSDRTFKKDLKNCIETTKKFVIFCLDNSSQIEELTTQLAQSYLRNPKMKEIKRIAIIHDEADTITKDKETELKNNDQAKSHQQWIELKELITKQMAPMELKRVFVTATPENCMMLYNIECPDVMRLEIPAFYRGYKDIEHVDLEDDDDINELIKEEVERIRDYETSEAILYCIDRKVEDGHTVVFKSLSKKLNCIVNTYNGQGISTYMRTKELCVNFEKKLKKENIKYIKKDKYYNIKNLSIRTFYSILKKIGERCVVTIGKDLICRGISYVGDDQRHPITATTMFYKPGKTMHAVGINQSIGRITGCAMYNLPRKLYTPQNVYDTYIRYNKNQEQYMKSIEKNSEMSITKEVIERLVFEKYERKIDRIKLNLYMNMREPRSDDESEPDSDEEDKIDGVDLNKVRRWIHDDSVVGKMIKYLYLQNAQITFEQFKNGINYTGTDKEFESNLSSGRALKSQYGKLWSYTNNNIIINPKIKEYMNTLRITN